MVVAVELISLVVTGNAIAKNIVSERDGVPVFENGLGCALVPYHEGNAWGLGTFYLNGAKLGETVTNFAVEESVGRSYQASQYQIVENSLERGSVRFFGKDGKLDFSVIVSLSNDSYAYTLEYDFDPMHPIYHPLFVNVPFFTSKAAFVKYPYEDTMMPPLGKRWVVTPDVSRAPFFLGMESLDGKEAFVGVGYFLSDHFDQGRFEFDPVVYPDAPFKIYTPFDGMARPIDLQCVTRLELIRTDLVNQGQLRTPEHRFRIVISTASNQFNCVRAYIGRSGYDTSLTIRRSIDESVSDLMDVYKRTKGYVKGKGYHQLIRFDTGDFDTTVPHGWYSKYIVAGPQVQLAYELYKYWETHPEETWARERATEMADFMLSMQQEGGAFANWDTDVGGTSIMHPDDTQGTKFNACIYSMSDMGMGLYHLDLLYDEMKRFEGIDRADWKAAAEKGVRFMASLVKPDGELGRNYDLKGNYDKQTTGIIEALMVFDLAHKQTGDKKLEEARDRLENWLCSRFIRFDNWCNGSVDGGAWQGTDWPPPHNNDLMGTFTFASYCVSRYQETRDEKYIQLAKDAVAYIWMCVTPIEIEGFRHGTRTLVREQDFYSMYGILIRGNDFIDALPYLSKVSGDPFFMQFYRIIIQNQMDYQAVDKPYPGFHIGLDCDATGRRPVDKFAEGNSGYIVRFASLFLKTVNSPIAYRYVGGEGWGLGADYNLAFNPDFGARAPYVLSASTTVRDISWNLEKKVLTVFLYDTSRRQGSLEVKWRPELYPVSAVTIEMDGKQVKAADFYDEQEQVIRIPYKHQDPSEVVRVHCNN